MLLSKGRISKGDYGEESLVSRFILALILNEFSSVNQHECQAFRKFGKRCLGLDFTMEDMKRGSATVEFQANRCSNHPDKTKFDAIFTIEKECVWGIEAKYFDNLGSDQIKREVGAIENIAHNLGYTNAGVLFLLPEQQIGTIILSNKETRNCIANLIKEDRIHIRLASWEIIFEIIKEYGNDQIRKEINEYCKYRNQNKSGYPTELSPQAKINNYAQWNELIKNPKSVPKDLPKLKITPHAKDYGRSSSKLNEIFHGNQIELVLEIIGKSDFEPQYRKTGYANLYKNKKANAQLHPSDSGIDIVIKDADEDCPECTILTKKDISSLAGYKGTNKGWLDGVGKRGTTSPAIAFTIPMDLIKNPRHEGWHEIEALLKYAHKK